MNPDLPNALTLLGLSLFLLAVIPLVPITRVLASAPDNSRGRAVGRAVLLGLALCIAVGAGLLVGHGTALAT